MCQNIKQNLSLILTDALNSTVSVIKIVDPTWTGLAQLETDAQAAIDAVNNWTPGTPAQDAVEILDVLIADVNLFSQIPGLSPAYVAVIAVALNGIKSVIVLIEEHSTGTTQAAAAAAMARTAATTIHTSIGDRAVDAWEAPTKMYEGARSYALDWNAAIKASPDLASAKLNVPKKWHILP